MKNKFLFLFLLLTCIVNAQVGVGTLSPNVKSMLDITSVEKGILIPRLTFAQITAINPSSGENGLFVYNTDENCINFWNGTSWQSLCGGGSVCDPSGLAEYSLDCNQFPAADTNSYVVNTNMSGSVTVSVNVTKAGPYYITITSADNSVNYSANGDFTAAQVGTTVSVTLTGGGTPSVTPVNFTVKGNGINICTYSKSALTAAVYTCNSATANGTYTVATDLTTSNNIIVSLNVSQAGVVKLVSEDKNGIKFESAEVNLPVGTSQTVTLNAVDSSTGNYPMMSEETTKGKNGTGYPTASQSDNYLITNLSNGQDLLCKATIDVKPRRWTSSGSIAGVTTKISGLSSGNLQMFMQDQNSLQGGVGTYFKVWVENTTTTDWTNVSTRTVSSYESAFLLSWDGGTITPGERLGSLDGYQQALLGTARPSFAGEYGAHAGPNSALSVGELSDNGLTFKWTAPATGTNMFAGLGTKYYKYRVNWYSKPLGETKWELILIGIYDDQVDPDDIPQTYVPKAYLGANDTDASPAQYWP